MGRGSSKTGGSSLTASNKKEIINGIKNHTKEQNDAAERNMLSWLNKEKDIIDNYSNYVKVGHIKSKNDPWWKEHEKSYKGLQAQLSFFRKQRQKIGR